MRVPGWQLGRLARDQLGARDGVRVHTLPRPGGRTDRSAVHARPAGVSPGCVRPTPAGCTPLPNRRKSQLLQRSIDSARLDADVGLRGCVGRKWACPQTFLAPMVSPENGPGPFWEGERGILGPTWARVEGSRAGVGHTPERGEGCGSADNNLKFKGASEKSHVDPTIDP